MPKITRLPGTPEPMHYWNGYEGVRIAGDSWGDPKGPLVLLLHGGGQTRHAWKGLGEVLGGAGYHAVALDARGHGDTGWAGRGKYDSEFMVKDIQCVLKQLGNRRPAMVGASMGGRTSLLAIGEGFIDAAALVLVDVAPHITREGRENIHRFMDQKKEGFESLDEVAAAIANYQPHRKRPRNLDGLAKNVRLWDDGKYHWHWDPDYRIGRGDPETRSERAENCARNLRLPTLLVRGGLSDLLSEEGAKEFLKLAPHAEFVSVDGAAHMVAGDRNDIFGSAVIEFLGRVVPVKATAK